MKWLIAMKDKILKLILWSFLIFIGCSQSLYADQIIQRSIKVGGDNHLPPYEYINDNGIYKGFNVDIMRAVAIQVGLDIELKPMPWYMLPIAMDNGEIEAIQGINASQQYDDLYDFSIPYLTTSRGIFVRQNNNYIANLEDLSCVRVAVQKGNVPNKVLKYVDRDTLIYVDNQQQGILLLMMGNIDAFVGNRLVGSYTIQKWRQTNFIKIVGEPIEPAQYAVAVKKGNQELLNLFNSGLKEIKDNGTYEKIYNKWFGEIIQTPAEMWRSIVKKILWGSTIILGAFLLILRGNQVLKTEVKKRTAELDEANKQLLEKNQRIEKDDKLKEQILESVFHGIITLEEEGVIHFANTQAKFWLEHLGEGEIIGKQAKETPVRKIIDSAHLGQVFMSGNSLLNQEKLIVLNDEKKVFGYSIYPLKYHHNELSGAIISFRDITRDKIIQDTLIRKDKMQSLGKLVATIAHEIRNPLMAIKTFVELIPTKWENEKFRQKLFRYVPQELERLNSLVTSLLEYAKPRQACKEELKINEMLTEVLTLFESKLKENNIELLTNVPGVIIVYADRQQLKQILINLILNAVQSMEGKGILEVNVIPKEKETYIEIKDTGAGIAAKFLGRVMDPFFTLKEDGTGLGLSISYQLIKEHGGEIYINSKENEGTIVSVVLPNKKGSESIGEGSGSR